MASKVWCCGKSCSAAGLLALVRDRLLPSIPLISMTTPGLPAIVIILVVVLFTNAVHTLLSFIPLGLFVAAIAYVVRHV